MTATTLFEQGNSLFDQGRVDEAIAAYRAAVGLNPAFAQAHNNLGVALRLRGRLDEAVASCREAVRLTPADASAWSNLGTALQRQGLFGEAIAAYRHALESNPNHATAHYNLGCALRIVGHTREAAEALRTAVRLKPTFADAYANLGGVLREDQDLEGALAAYEEALRLKPDWGGPAAQIMHLRREMGQWAGLEAHEHALRQAVATGSALSAGIPPFSMLATGASGSEQLMAARQWSAHARLVPAPGAQHRHWRQRPLNRPLRIGYLSSDFHEHATAYLIAGVLEEHGRRGSDGAEAAFEITAYSYGPDSPDGGSDMRRRLQAACDHFVDIRALTDAAAAARIVADEIDILVDLKGFTQQARTAILTWRPAPIQVQFVGYPGTMGTPIVDYLIADRFVVPEASFSDYDERVIHLPDCCQPNDPKRAIGPAPTRQAAGLPDTGFVFTSFNETYKITPTMFDVWMRLLGAAPGNVLWLLESNRWAADNLRREAQARGVDAGRLIFAPRVQNTAHLGRLQLADLVLDTLPVNAHTTASDALWAGVPVLTCAGDTFVSRVAGSLLHTMGLPDLVTAHLEEYERRALELCANKETLAALRARVAEGRRSSPLFDACRFARHLEAAYRAMWDRYASSARPS